MKMPHNKNMILPRSFRFAIQQKDIAIQNILLPKENGLPLKNVDPAL